MDHGIHGLTREWHTEVMGLSACLIFAAARLPECYSGWARSHRGQEPMHSLSDPLFYFLIIENVRIGNIKPQNLRAG